MDESRLHPTVTAEQKQKTKNTHKHTHTNTQTHTQKHTKTQNRRRRRGETDRQRLEAKRPCVNAVRRHSWVANDSKRCERRDTHMTLMDRVSPHTSALRMMLLGPGQICGTEMEENRKVSSLISRSQAKRSIVKLVAAMCIHTPLIWTLWHDEKPIALTVLLFQRTKSPQE